MPMESEKPARWLYLDFDEEVGPLTSAELKKHAQQGRITEETYLRTTTSAGWVQASKVFRFFPSLRICA